MSTGVPEPGVPEPGVPEPGDPEPDPLAEATPAQRLILLGCGFLLVAVLVVVLVFAIAFTIRSL